MHPFAPKGIHTLIRYSDLEGFFNENYNCILELGNKAENQRFSPLIPDNEMAKELAEILNDALINIKNIIEIEKNDNLIRYFQTKLNNSDNRAYPIYIRVNSKLPVNSARYYNKSEKKVEILFNEQFVNDLIGAYHQFKEAVPIIFGERLFHELCHNNYYDINQAILKESNRIERDRQLHNIILMSGKQSKIDEYYRELHPIFKSGYYFKFLESLNSLTEEARKSAIEKYLRQHYPVTFASNLAILLERIDLKKYNTNAKFVIYSGPPGGGKSMIWERFITLFDRIIERFILFHTRSMRTGEIQDVTYHYRTKEHLEKLRNEGKIITAYINRQLQGLAKVTFEDTYIDPETKEEKKVIVKGLDSIFLGDKIVILECGLAWFEALKSQYPDLYSIFISPYSTEYLETKIKDEETAFDAIIGKEIAIRIHQRECIEAEISAKKFKENPTISNIYVSTPQIEYITRINEAVKQVKRRNEYQLVLVDEQKHEHVVEELTEQFAKGIFTHVLKAMNIPFNEESSADNLVTTLSSSDLKSKITPAKLTIYSGPLHDERVLAWKRFNEKYGNRENMDGEKLISKFRLFHTRLRRPNEVQNINYYFREETHLNRLRHEHKILTALINNQLQGLPLESFEDVYIDPETKEKNKCEVIGLDAVFKGSQIVILEGGLGWFEQLRNRFGNEILSIFISPFSDEFIEKRSKNPHSAFEAIIGKEIALRIHMREWKESKLIKENLEKSLKEGNINVNQVKLFFPTPQKEFINRIEEAVEQVKRRTEYTKVLTNKWVHSDEEFRSTIKELTEEFAVSIFSNLYNKLDEGYVKA